MYDFLRFRATFIPVFEVSGRIVASLAGKKRRLRAGFHSKASFLSLLVAESYHGRGLFFFFFVYLRKCIIKD